jgi:hypothetical protein
MQDDSGLGEPRPESESTRGSGGLEWQLPVLDGGTAGRFRAGAELRAVRLERAAPSRTHEHRQGFEAPKRVVCCGYLQVER